MTEKAKMVIAGFEECLADKHRRKTNHLDHGECPYRFYQKGCIVRLQKDAYEVLCEAFGLTDMKTFEETFPDCPSCKNMRDGDCRVKGTCLIEVVSTEGCRVGNPSNWLPTEDNMH